MRDSGRVGFQEKIVGSFQSRAYAGQPEAVAKQECAEPEAEGAREGGVRLHGKNSKTHTEHVKGCSVAEIMGGFFFRETNFEFILGHNFVSEQQA